MNQEHALARRHEWFESTPGPAYVLWRVGRGGRPSLSDGKERLDHLAAHGPTPHAFTFDVRFDASAPGA